MHDSLKSLKFTESPNADAGFFSLFHNSLFFSNPEVFLNANMLNLKKMKQKEEFGAFDS